MSSDKSEVQKAAEKVNPQQVKDNLKSGESEVAKTLSEEEQTQFIEEKLRTDK